MTTKAPTDQEVIAKYEAIEADAGDNPDHKDIAMKTAFDLQVSYTRVRAIMTDHWTARTAG